MSTCNPLTKQSIGVKIFLPALSMIVFAIHSNGQEKIVLKEHDHVWMQTVLNNWDSVCRKKLNIPVQPLPWIIFYDSITAWHINPDEKLLPPGYKKSSLSLQFEGRKYNMTPLIHAAGLWMPGRQPIPVASFPIMAMPYDENRKTFFVAPLPSVFHTLASADQAEYLDFLFLGTGAHELTHTRQLAFVLPQILNIQKSYKLPESVDDNIIETNFNKNEDYKRIFFEEKKHLWSAIFTANKDSCLLGLRNALSLAEQRKNLFFAGDSAGYNQLEDIFLSLEGSAMWAQYQVMCMNAPGQPAREILVWLLQRSESWVQEEGLALFLLIDKFVPGWTKKFFGKALPSPFQILRTVIDKQSGAKN